MQRGRHPDSEIPAERGHRGNKLPPVCLTQRRAESYQIIPASYNNETKRIPIPDVPLKNVQDSPEDIKIPVPPSGVVSPATGIGTPLDSLEGSRTPNDASAGGTNRV